MTAMATFIGVGNLTEEPTLRFTPGGVPVSNFNVAINTGYKKGDTWIENDPTYMSVVAWNKMGENCGTLHKGDRVVVVGRQQTQTFEREDGSKGYRTSVVADVVALTLEFNNLAELYAKATQPNVEEPAAEGAPEGDEPF